MKIERQDKNNSNLGFVTVQDTLLGPLWGRATYSKLYPQFLNDPKALEIFAKIKFDEKLITNVIKPSGREYFGLVFLARAYQCDKALKKYIEKYPYASIINLGAGLDTSFYRIDNGKISWYDVDFPEVIAQRKQIIEPHERCFMIGSSVLDLNWFDQVHSDSTKGTFIIGAGLLMYFKEPEVISLITHLAQRFPEGEFIFDTVQNWVNRMRTKKMKKIQKKAPIWYFGIDNLKKWIKKNFQNIEIVQNIPIWKNIPISPQWSKTTKKTIKIFTFFRLGKIHQLHLNKV